MTKEMRKITILCVATIIFVVVAIGCIYKSQGNFSDGTTHVMLDRDWTITVGGETFTDVNLNEFLFDLQNEGDVLTMTRTMPDRTLADPTLIINTIHCIIDVYLDQELIYSYGHEEAEKNWMVGYGPNTISLREGYEGKKLTIRFVYTEDEATNHQDSPILYNANYMYRDYLIQHKLNMGIDVSLVIFGLFFTLVFALFSIHSPRYTRLVSISIFAMCIGLWSLCNNNLITFFTYDLRVKSTLEFWCLYVAPLALLLYFINDKSYLTNKYIRIMYRIALVLEVIFVLVAGILCSHAVNLYHMPDFLACCHMLIAYDFLVTILMTLYRVKKEKKMTIMMMAMIVLLCFVFTDMIVFNVQKYSDAVTDKTYNSISPIGIFIFIIAILLDFMLSDMAMMRQNAKMEVLHEFAYNDPLTGCFSRRWFEENTDKLSNKDEYGLLIYDMNHLKEVNDKMGHARGDMLISQFAHILREVFQNCASVARIGGDEFAVLFPKVEGLDVEHLIALADREMLKASKPEEGYYVSAAHGYVDCRENPKAKFAEIYAMADQRMYQYKADTGHSDSRHVEEENKQE